VSPPRVGSESRDHRIPHCHLTDDVVRRYRPVHWRNRQQVESVEGYTEVSFGVAAVTFRVETTVYGISNTLTCDVAWLAWNARHRR
jgi:hypothetical protein